MESTGDECMDEFLLVCLGEKTFNCVNVSELVTALMRLLKVRSESKDIHSFTCDQWSSSWWCIQSSTDVMLPSFCVRCDIMPSAVIQQTINGFISIPQSFYTKKHKLQKRRIQIGSFSDCCGIISNVNWNSLNIRWLILNVTTMVQRRAEPELWDGSRFTSNYSV